MNILRKAEQWLDTPSWNGWPRVTWLIVAMAIGSAICITLGRML